MEVLLRYNVENLGSRGEVVRVRDGYARNYLFPTGLAIAVSKENRRRLDAQKERFEQEELKRIDELKVMAQKLADLKLIIVEARANSDGHLYGSVAAAKICEELDEQGFKLDHRSIRLEEPIRRTGTHEVPIQLHPEVSLQILCWVTEEGADADPADAPPVGGWPEEDEAAEGEEGTEGEATSTEETPESA
ncbi:MAG: 50S ribosomal protein L9 [Planctomycetota bacterium]